MSSAPSHSPVVAQRYGRGCSPGAASTGWVSPHTTSASASSGRRGSGAPASQKSSASRKPRTSPVAAAMPAFRAAAGPALAWESTRTGPPNVRAIAGPSSVDPSSTTTISRNPSAR